jgi:hypothetical protein
LWSKQPNGLKPKDVGYPDGAFFVAHDCVGRFNAEALVLISCRDLACFFEAMPQEQLMNFTHVLIRTRKTLPSSWTLLTEAI